MNKEPRTGYMPFAVAMLTGSLALAACASELQPAPGPTTAPTCSVDHQESDKMIIGNQDQVILDCPDVSGATMDSIIQHGGYVFVPGEGDCHVMQGTSPGTSKGQHYMTAGCKPRITV